jgi:hypothetical protein
MTNGKKIVTKCNNILTVTLLVFVLLFFESCSIGRIADSEAGNPVITAGVLINMPSSLASALKRAPTADQAEDIYTGIRLQNYWVNQLVNGQFPSARWLIEEYIAKLPWEIIKATGDFHTDSSLYIYEASYNADLPLPYRAHIRYTLPGSEWSVTTVFNGDNEQPKGWIYFFLNAPVDNRTDSVKTLLSFEKVGDTRLLNVKIRQKLLVDTGDIAQSFIYSLSEQKGIIHLSAASYHPYLDSILDDTVGYCYTYTAVADTNVNRAVVNLGLPPAVYPDSMLVFTEYGIASIYGRYFINYEIKNLDDSCKMILATSFKDSMTVLEIIDTIAKDPNFPLRPASDADAMTVDDLIFYLELNKGIWFLLTPQDQIKYIALLWILKLRQPVYFSFLGYVGNGEQVPIGFKTIAAIKCDRAVHIPRNVRDLVIDISSF